eukprot:2401023-Pleurochrysis_carterae.AAC.3
MPRSKSTLTDGIPSLATTMAVRKTIVINQTTKVTTDLSTNDVLEAISVLVKCSGMLMPNM